MDKITQLETRITSLESQLNILLGLNKFIFNKHLQIIDARNIQVGKGVGTKLGTEATQKIGMYGTTPVIQASAISAPATQSGSYVASDVQSIVTAVNSIRTALKNIGITA